MKWETDVFVEKREDEYFFQHNNTEYKAAKEDAYIIEAIDSGVADDDEIVSLVMQTEKENEIIARLRLAQFILDYSDYISNDVGHMIIEP